MIKIPKNCKFYHVQEIQGLDKPTKGPFDLRKNIYQLLGNDDVVLEQQFLVRIYIG